jgi:hypothetical protein
MSGYHPQHLGRGEQPAEFGEPLHHDVVSFGRSLTGGRVFGEQAVEPFRGSPVPVLPVVLAVPLVHVVLRM